MNVPHFLFGINDFGLQICWDDPPPEGAKRIGSELKSLVLHFSCINISPLVRAQQDHVLSAEAQSSSGLLDGIVAL